jgi:hypothetical protein
LLNQSVIWKNALDINDVEEDEIYKFHRYTPLHMAVDMKIAASINIMLKYMAKFEYAVFRTFGRILPELI